MEGFITFLLGIFSGSVGTTVVKFFTDKKQKEIDFKRESSQKEVEFKRDLEKTYFLSKLKAATEYYAQLNVLVGSLHHTKILLMTIRDPRYKEGDDSIKKGIQENLVVNAKKGVTKSEDLATTAALSFGLFFDSPNEEKYMKLSQELHLDQLKLDTVSNLFRDIENLYLDKELPEEVKKDTETEYNYILEMYFTHMDNLIGQFEAFINFLKTRMQELNTYYKKYDKY